MNRRRVDLGLTWRKVERAADLSYEGLRGIRRGDRRPSDLTARRLDDALQWEHGSVQAILDGGEPTPRDELEPAVQAGRAAMSVDARLDAVEQQLATLVTDVLEMRQQMTRDRAEQRRNAG